MTVGMVADSFEAVDIVGRSFDWETVVADTDFGVFALELESDRDPSLSYERCRVPLGLMPESVAG